MFIINGLMIFKIEESLNIFLGKGGPAPGEVKVMVFPTVYNDHIYGSIQQMAVFYLGFFLKKCSYFIFSFNGI